MACSTIVKPDFFLIIIKFVVVNFTIIEKIGYF